MRMFVFFNDAATTEIYTLSLHDALPICHPGRRGGDRRRALARPPLSDAGRRDGRAARVPPAGPGSVRADPDARHPGRSEEHTSELQSRQYLVCRLLLEKKKATVDSTMTE